MTSIRRYHKDGSASFYFFLGRNQYGLHLSATEYADRAYAAMAIRRARLRLSQGQ